MSIRGGICLRNFHRERLLEMITEGVAEHSNQTLEIVSGSNDGRVQLCQVCLILCEEFLHGEEFNITVVVLGHLQRLDSLIQRLHPKILSDVEWAQ